MKRMIASICVAGSLLIAPIQSFAGVNTGGNQQKMAGCLNKTIGITM